MTQDPRNGSIQFVASSPNLSIEFDPAAEAPKLRVYGPTNEQSVDFTLPVAPTAPYTVEDVAKAVGGGEAAYVLDVRAGVLAIKVGDQQVGTCPIPTA